MRLSPKVVAALVLAGFVVPQASWAIDTPTEPSQPVTISAGRISQPDSVGFIFDNEATSGEINEYRVIVNNTNANSEASPIVVFIGDVKDDNGLPRLSNTWIRSISCENSTLEPYIDRSTTNYRKSGFAITGVGAGQVGECVIRLGFNKVEGSADVHLLATHQESNTPNTAHVISQETQRVNLTNGSNYALSVARALNNMKAYRGEEVGEITLSNTGDKALPDGSQITVSVRGVTKKGDGSPTWNNGIFDINAEGVLAFSDWVQLHRNEYSPDTRTVIATAVKTPDKQPTRTDANDRFDVSLISRTVAPNDPDAVSLLPGYASAGYVVSEDPNVKELVVNVRYPDGEVETRIPIVTRIATPSAPDVNNPPGRNNATWIVPQDSDEIDWNLNSRGELFANAKEGYEFANGSNIVEFGRAPDPDTDPTVIDIPPAPRVTDPEGPDNAEWNLPRSDEEKTWEVNDRGELIVRTKPGYTFPGGATEHNYGKAPDSGNLRVVPAPQKLSHTDPPGVDNATWDQPFPENEAYVWSLTPQGELKATAKEGFTFPNNVREVNYGKAPDVGYRRVNLPPAPRVVDPEGPNNAHYERPVVPDDSPVTLTLSPDGKTLVATIKDATADRLVTPQGLAETYTYPAPQDSDTRQSTPVPPAPPVNDPDGKDNATWEKPADTDSIAWTINDKGELIATTKDGHVFDDLTTTHNYGKAPDSGTPQSVPTPARPSVTDPRGENNSTWSKPADSESITWETYNDGRGIRAHANDGYAFDNGETTIDYGTAPDAGNEETSLPPQPTVTDPDGLNNATWEKPADTDKVTWEIDNYGNLIAHANDGYTFPGGATEHNYGKAPDSGNPVTIQIPPARTTTGDDGRTVWDVPASTDEVDYRVNDRGELIATTKPGVRFADGSTEHNYGAPKGSQPSDGGSGTNQPGDNGQGGDSGSNNTGGTGGATSGDNPGANPPSNGSGQPGAGADDKQSDGGNSNNPPHTVTPPNSGNNTPDSPQSDNAGGTNTKPNNGSGGTQPNNPQLDANGGDQPQSRPYNGDTPQSDIIDSPQSDGGKSDKDAGAQSGAGAHNGSEKSDVGVVDSEQSQPKKDSPQSDEKATQKETDKSRKESKGGESSPQSDGAQSVSKGEQRLAQTGATGGVLAGALALLGLGGASTALTRRNRR